MRHQALPFLLLAASLLLGCPKSGPAPGAGTPPPGQTQAQPPIDPLSENGRLQRAIADATGIAEGGLTLEARAKLTTLDLTGQSFDRLEGIETCPNLTTLILVDSGPVNSLAPLAGLKKLETLDIAAMKKNRGVCAKKTGNWSGNAEKGSQINAEDLAGLTSLKTLNLSANTICSVPALKSLEHLETLIAIECDVIDLSEFPSMAALTTIDLAGNPNLTDLSGLRGTSTLTDVRIPGCPVDALTPLSALTTLRHLELGPALLTAISDLPNYPTLESLAFVITETGADVVPPLAPLSNLRSLNIEVVDPTHLAALDGLHLDELTLSLVGTTDTSHLPAQSGLKRLTINTLLSREALETGYAKQFLRGGQKLMYGNHPLPSVLVLDKLPGLEELTLTNAPDDRDFSPILRQSNLKSLTIQLGPMPNLTFTDALPLLETLQLGRGEISDVGPLVARTHLKRLALTGNPLADPAPFAQMAGLTHVDVRDCGLSDFSAFDTLPNLVVLAWEGVDNPVKYEEIQKQCPTLAARGAIAPPAGSVPPSTYAPFMWSDLF